MAEIGDLDYHVSQCKGFTFAEPTYGLRQIDLGLSPLVGEMVGSVLLEHRFFVNSTSKSLIPGEKFIQSHRARAELDERCKSVTQSEGLSGSVDTIVYSTTLMNKTQSFYNLL